MNTSDSIDKIIPALIKSQQELGAVTKDKKNPFFKSNYADINAFLSTVKPIINANGLLLMQPSTAAENGEVAIETTLFHVSGQWISSEIRMKPAKSGPQEVGSCITYARRYALQSLLSLEAVDDDGNLAQRGRMTGTITTALKPATSTESTTSFDDLIGRVRACTSEEGLQAIVPGINGAADAGSVTPDQLDAVRKAWKMRRDSL